MGILYIYIYVYKIHGLSSRVDSKMCETMKLLPQDQRDFDFGNNFAFARGGEYKNEDSKAKYAYHV